MLVSIQLTSVGMLSQSSVARCYPTRDDRRGNIHHNYRGSL